MDVVFKSLAVLVDLSARYCSRRVLSVASAVACRAAASARQAKGLSPRHFWPSFLPTRLVFVSNL